LVSARCQTDAPVDDVKVKTSEGGTVFVQAKRTVHLSTAEKSPLMKALDQFIQQYKSCAETASGVAEPLDRASTVLC
jgi:hypothetical protein